MFSDEILCAIGAWQNGWQEQQDRREILADKIRKAVQHLPIEFREVKQYCFRKRYLHKGELLELIMADHRDEGLVSWTTERAFAERFKGLYRAGAVSGAIFRHMPKPTEVILNISALWQSNDFVAAATKYRSDSGLHADALFNFADNQGEVILDAPLRGSEIVALTGASSPFDELCDSIGIAESARDEIYRKLVNQGVYPGEYQYVSDDAAQRVICNTIRKMNEKMAEALRMQPSN